MTDIFDPIEVGGIKLNNRFTMAPMETGLAEPGGRVNDRLIQYFMERANNDLSLIMTGSIAVSPEGRGLPNVLSCYDDQFIEGLKRLTDAIHTTGAKIGGQIYHAGRQTSEQITGLQPVAPSPIPCPVMKSNPRELREEDIERLVESFRNGAKRLVEAGFDLIEIHLAHGYLLHSFLSPLTNNREDKYGGSLENRTRFPLTVVREIIKEIGNVVPVTVRISGDEYLDGGLGIEEVKQICQCLVEVGVQGISVSAGSYGSVATIIQPMSYSRGFIVPLAEQIKKVVDVPVIVAGRLNDPELIRSIVREKKADAVALGRVVLADSAFVRKIKEKKEKELRRCIACNQGCIDRVLLGQHATCLVNAEAGYELERKIQPSHNPKTVVVVGGGPAGMEGARVASLRGHRVVLVEKDNHLGEKVRAAAAPPGKEEFGLINDFLISQVEGLPIELELGKEATSESILAYNPDVVIVATGSFPSIPEVVRQSPIEYSLAEHVLLGKETVEGYVVVMGGGSLGVETGEFLAEKGTKVTIVEQKQELGEELGPIIRPLILGKLEELDIEICTETEIVSINDHQIEAIRDGQSMVLTPDSLVVGAGYTPHDEIYHELKHCVDQVYLIGDAQQVRSALHAIHTGYVAGCEI